MHMQKVKVKGHTVQKVEWKQTDRQTGALPPVLTFVLILKRVVYKWECKYRNSCAALSPDSTRVHRQLHPSEEIVRCDAR